MAGSFTTTGSYSNLTRLELEQLRKADFFAGGKALTVGDSALLPEGIIGKGDINAEPYLTGPSVLLDDVYSLTPVATPGSYLGTLTQVAGTASDSVAWYGPTVKASGLLGGATGVGTFTDTTASFIVSGVLAGDILLIKDITDTPGVPKNMQAVATISVVGATALTLTNIVAPSNAPTTQLGVDGQKYAYLVIRPGVTQLFAVPGSGPTGKEQTFLAVIPASTLHTNLSPTLNQINTDRVKSLVPSQYTHDTAIDRADGVYASPAPRVALDKLGYRIVLYPSAGAGGPDFTKPITSINPIIDPAIPAGDQRFTVDYKSGTIRFSCAPQPGSDINPNSFVNATTGRLDLYAVFWAVDQTLTAGSARGLYASRNTAVRPAAASRLYFNTYGWSGGSYSSVTQTGGAFGSDDILRLYDAQTVSNAGVNGGRYVPLTSTTADNGDQVARLIDKASGDVFTTIAVASNGLALPQGTINVADTSAFAKSGSIMVDTTAGSEAVTYTNKTATTFTGCTGGTGTMATGGTVTKATASILRSLNARYYCTVGNGFTSFGDFNGTNAISAALAFIQTIAFGISAATIFVKAGSYSTSGTLDVGVGSSIHLSIIGYGAGNGVTGSSINAPAAAVDTIHVHNASTLYLKGVHVASNGAAGTYSVRVSDTGQCRAEDCVLDNVINTSLSSGAGVPASYRRCTFTGTAAEAAITIEAGNSTNCGLVTVDESTFTMGANPVPPIRFRALVGPLGTIEGLRCSKSRFTTAQTTNTGTGTFGNLTANTGLVDLVPSGEDSRAKTRAVVTGGQDMSVGGLYGGGGALNGTSLTLDVNGGGATTLALNGLTNAASFGALATAIQVLWPAIAVSLDGSKFLVLTDTSAGSPNYLQVHVNTANAILGLTPGVTYATGLELGATVQECSFDECTITTPLTHSAGAVNVLLHLIPRGNASASTSDVNGTGPYMQIDHFKLHSSRLTSSLGDPSVTPGVFQTIPFSAVNGAHHFEMDDCTFTIVPSAAFVEAVIPDDTAYDYTGGATPPSIERFGYIAISCPKVTAKKIVGKGFPQIASIGDMSIRTNDINAEDIEFSAWTDGGLGSTPSHRLIFEAIAGNYSGGSIRNVKMTGQQATGGAWATSGGAIMALLEWNAQADRHLVVSGGRIAKFTIAGITPIGSWAGMRVKSANIISGIEIDDYYVDSARYGIYIGTGAQTIYDVSITRCNTSFLGSGGLGHGIWIYINAIDQLGIRIENNTANGNVAEGILVDADILTTGSWIGNVWLTQNTTIGNNASAGQILLNARTITSIHSTASNNICGFGEIMRILKAGGVANPDAALGEHLRGWQTIGGLTSYADAAVMLFNEATFKKV